MDESDLKKSIAAVEKFKREPPEPMSEEMLAGLYKAFCSCPCHKVIQIGLVPCPHCEGKPCL
jgi:hypothetical protein